MNVGCLRTEDLLFLDILVVVEDYLWLRQTRDYDSAESQNIY